MCAGEWVESWESELVNGVVSGLRICCAGCVVSPRCARSLVVEEKQELGNRKREAGRTRGAFEPNQRVEAAGVMHREPLFERHSVARESLGATPPVGRPQVVGITIGKVCTQIVIAVKESQANSLKGVLPKPVYDSRRTCDVIDRLLGDGYVCFWPAYPDCGCGWFHVPMEELTPQEIEELWTRHQKHGLSHARTEEAVTRAVEKRQREVAAQPRVPPGLCVEGRRWASAAARAVGSVHLIVYEPGDMRNVEFRTRGPVAADDLWNERSPQKPRAVFEMCELVRVVGVK